MKILLINNNPVVSRLTALSARKENVVLDEIKNISELKTSDYNIIFVDEESYNNDVSNIIRNSGVKNRVLFYTEGNKENQSIFNRTILKPFLPSEVSEILRETNVSILKAKEQEQKEKQPSVDFKELVKENKEKELEAINILDKKEPALAAATVASIAIDKKSEIDEKAKENLKLEEKYIEELNLEKLSSEKNETKKDTFDLKIEEAFPLNLEDNKEQEKDKEKIEISPKKDTFELDDDLFELDDKKASNKSESKLNDLFELDDKKDELKDGFDDNLFEIDKKIKKDILDDSPLDFDLESKNEVNFKATEEIEVAKKPEITEEPETSTKILNKSDISDIKNILNEEKGSESLTEIPTSLMSITKTKEDTQKETNIEKEDTIEKISNELETNQEVSQKQPPKKKKHLGELSTGAAIADTLNKLPVKDLRQLLRGAKVNISIEFPNEV